MYHPLVLKLFNFCRERFARADWEECLAFNCREAAQDCKNFMRNRILSSQKEAAAAAAAVEKIRLIEYLASPSSTSRKDNNNLFKAPTIYLIFFHQNFKKVAKEYWQHTGAGISSRFAEFCLMQLDLFYLFPRESQPTSPGPKSIVSFRKEAKSHLKRIEESANIEDADLFVEERFGRNLDPSLVKEARSKLKSRIAGVLGDGDSEMKAIRGLDSKVISEKHVFLFNCGMAAIYFSHQVIRKLSPGLRTVQFGYRVLLI